MDQRATHENSNRARGEASNHLKLRWLKTVVVSVEEKA